MNLGLSHAREEVNDWNLSMSVNTDNKLINGIESVKCFLKSILKISYLPLKYVNNS